MLARQRPDRSRPGDLDGGEEQRAASVKMGDRTPGWSFDQLAEFERSVACGHHCADGNPQHGRGFPR
jgi:hypothetical protein